MKHQYRDIFTTNQTAKVFVSIIANDTGQYRISAAFSHRQALDDLVDYLNLIMDDEVLLKGASEVEICTAVEDNLYASVEIVECDP